MSQQSLNRLMILLAAQLLLVVAIYSGSGSAPPPAAGPLFGFDPAAVNRLELADGDGRRLTLVRTDGSWQIGEENPFPADGGRVDQLVRRIAALEGGALVADTATSRKRLKVADDAFERRVILGSGDQQLADLLVGSAAGMRRSHIRVAGQDAIHSAELALWSLATERHQWENKGVLGFSADQLQSIDHPELGRLVASEGEGGDGEERSTIWQLEQQPGRTIDQTVVGELLGQLANLRFERVAEAVASDTIDLDALKMELSLTITDRGRVDYRLYQPGDESGVYRLQVSNRGEQFRLAATTAEALIQAARAERIAPVAGE